MSGRAIRRCAAFIPLLLLEGSSFAQPPSRRAISVFHCLGDRSFTVERDERVAIVRYDSVSHELPRRRSSIGKRYAIGETTLIIDGEFATLVAGSVLNLGFCRQDRDTPLG